MPGNYEVVFKGVIIVEILVIAAFENNLFEIMKVLLENCTVFRLIS